MKQIYEIILSEPLGFEIVFIYTNMYNINKSYVCHYVLNYTTIIKENTLKY